MAITTITGQDALFAVAEEVGEVHTEYVAVATSDSIVVCRGISLGQNVTFAYGLARILNKGIRQITAYNDAIQRVTVASSFSSAVAAGDSLEVCYWEAKKRRAAWHAINEAIRVAWPFYYRERVTGDNLTGTVAKTSGSATLTGTSTDFLNELSVGDIISVPGGAAEIKAITAIASATSLTAASTYSNTSSGQTASLDSNITLAAGTNSVTLPASVDGLVAIGIRPAAADPIKWIPPKETLEDGTDQNYWRVEGVPGLYRVRFYPSFNRSGAIPDYYDTQGLLLHYVTKEPVLTAETGAGGATQLPAEYFSAVAGEIYRRRTIGSKEGQEMLTMAEMQEMARLALQRLGIGKRPANILVEAIAPGPAEAAK